MPGTPPGLDDRYRARGLRTDERIGWLPSRAAGRWPDRTALVCEDTRLTYAQLSRWVTRVAAWLVDAGIRPGDRLLWQLPNSVEAVVLHLAGWRIGALCVPVVPAYREHEMAQIFADARPSAVVFASTLGSRSPVAEMEALMDSAGVTPRVRISVGTDSAVARPGWTTLPAQPPDTALTEDLSLPDPAHAGTACLLLYTSGTTAKPKGALHSSATLLAEVTTLGRSLGYSHRDVSITGAPISHIAGLLLTALLPSAYGAKAVLLTKWDADTAVALASKEKATFSCGPTVFLQGFVEGYEANPEQHPHRLSSFMCGGAAISPSLIERADAAGIHAFRSWGMTEAPTVGLVGPDDSLHLRAHTDGRSSEGCEVQAVDADRNPLPPNTLGELRLRAPEQMLGYTDPTLDAEQVDSEGWFYTGDVGQVDADGWITMTGRLKDVINRGGEKFSAQDIEHAISSHAAVGAVAVTGLPDDRLGECVAAFVVLRQGRDWPGQQALLDHLEAQKLARAKFPTVWRQVDELPMTMSGKVQKNRLVELWEAERGAVPEPA
ncbi:MAG TPA: AMP-binding protein [Candidatus Dormibacteraeota bacterium]|jgi:acyl-CoA synthetase (AMP-forming)/AMP-acid ligase II|nr:AMP-binding protein [Candidatus Dormibacteraeota bacterium]